MKLLLIPLIAFTAVSCKKAVNVNEVIETQPHILTAHHVQVNGSIAGYYSALPVHYAVTTKRYPLLLLLHGSGQAGNGGTELSQVLTEGISSLLREKVFPPQFTVNGVHYSFLILMPQFNEVPKPASVLSFLNYATEHSRSAKTKRRGFINRS